MLQENLLNFLIWLPIFTGLIIYIINKNIKIISYISLIFLILEIFICFKLLYLFDPNNYHLQFVQQYNWIPILNAKYSLGIDGISVLFIILASFLNLILILSILKRTVKECIGKDIAIFLIINGIINGIFCAEDAFLFFFFLESLLIPIYIGLINQKNIQKNKSSIKFFLFNFLGSIFLLFYILYIEQKNHSFSMIALQNILLTKKENNFLFLILLIGFGIKIPIWPFHTWYIDILKESSSKISVVLLLLMIKTGIYGFIRFSLNIIFGINQNIYIFTIILSLISTIYTALVAITENNMKKLIAYSSMSHMGLASLGIFMSCFILNQKSNLENAIICMQGAIFQMISYSISSGALFLCIGYMQDRFKSNIIKNYQGIVNIMPLLSFFVMLFSLSNIGFPGTSGFIGEFLIILSSFKINIWIALFASFVLILSPVYTLWMYKRVFFGKINNIIKAFILIKDINGIELIVLLLMLILIIYFGIFPQYIFNISYTSTLHLVNFILLHYS